MFDKIVHIFEMYYNTKAELQNSYNHLVNCSACLQRIHCGGLLSLLRNAPLQIMAFPWPSSVGAAHVYAWVCSHLLGPQRPSSTMFPEDSAATDVANEGARPAFCSAFIDSLGESHGNQEKGATQCVGEPTGGEQAGRNLQPRGSSCIHVSEKREGN